MEKKIGRYEILELIGKGGMGEVFLAHDPLCKRKVALKKIRDDQTEKPLIHSRFLKEAEITASLTHPSIVPIYTIHKEEKGIYYTMPYVEGQTLQKIIQQTSEEEEEGQINDPIGGSIPALIRIFLNVCEAMAYTHSKQILHRDIKPDNIMVGKYGEVFILDWGIAEKIKDQKIPPPDFIPEKVGGTLSYMSPERAFGCLASVKTEIYSLGVILYRILTLKLPFIRKTLNHFRKTYQKEILINPIERAPYREIPHELSEITKKCLAKETPYNSINELIHDIKNYIEGRPDWIFLSNLNINEKNDWEFQEHILLVKHIAITRQIDISEWVSMMIAKGSFDKNLKIEADVLIKVQGSGIGFLLSIPEEKRRGLEEGYLIWLGSKKNPSIQLFRSNVLIIDVPNVFLEHDTWYHVKIEKVDDHLYFYLDHKLILSYASHLPLAGNQIGLLLKDADFLIQNIKVFGKSHNVIVNCLAVPNAFLARKEYAIALEEYRRIGHSFPGRAEGREALFRAGLTLLEKAKNIKDIKRKESLFQLALDEFENLHTTPGAPLEYLGKSLVYQALGDVEEEVKCLELSLRKFQKHPLFPILEEHIIYRLHESSLHNRKAAYHLALLSILHLPKILENPDTKNLLSNLQSHWEKLPFILPIDQKDNEEYKTHLAIQLCFWLSREKILNEILKTISLSLLLENGLYSLLEMGCLDEVNSFLKNVPLKNKQLPYEYRLIQIALLSHQAPLEKALDQFFQVVEKKWKNREIITFTHILKHSLDLNNTQVASKYLEKTKNYSIPNENKIDIDFLDIYTSLLSSNWERAKHLFSKYPLDVLSQENSPLYFLYGCWLYKNEGPEIAKIHFSSYTDKTFPRSKMLLGYFLQGKISEKNEWGNQAFFWEKRELYRQLALYFHCLDEEKKTKIYQKKAIKKVHEQT